MQHAANVGGVNWKTWMQHRWQMHSWDSLTSSQQAMISNSVLWDLYWTLTQGCVKVKHMQEQSSSSLIMQSSCLFNQWHSCPLELEERKCLWRKVINSEENKQQEPSQCKCLLLFLTGTLSHQLKQKNQHFITHMEGKRLTAQDKHAKTSGLQRCLWNKQV